MSKSSVKQIHSRVSLAVHAKQTAEEAPPLGALPLFLTAAMNRRAGRPDGPLRLKRQAGRLAGTGVCEINALVDSGASKIGQNCCLKRVLAIGTRFKDHGCIQSAIKAKRRNRKVRLFRRHWQESSRAASSPTALLRAVAPAWARGSVA